MNQRVCIVNYSEIKLKGKNRKFFEKKLRDNIWYILKKNYIDFNLHQEFGRLRIENINEKDVSKIKEILKDIPGISTFYFPFIFRRDEENILEKTVELVKKMDFNSFGVRCKRVDKRFPLNSQEVNVKLGSMIVQLGHKVNLDSPDLKVNIIIYPEEFHIFFEKERGLNGLPIGTSGKFISLISGGIDSPVASKLMSIRGAEIIYAHFFNFTNDSCGVKNKVFELIKIINKNSPPTKLYLIPFEKLQNEIITLCPPKYRMIIYRRSMFRIGNLICKKEKGKGFITGDSLGQVASQTIENISAIQNSSKYPIFTPLIGLNKEEITEKSRKFKLYETSILPYSDCCSFLIAKHPETKGNIYKILEIETKMEIENLENETFNNSEIVEIE